MDSTLDYNPLKQKNAYLINLKLKPEIWIKKERKPYWENRINFNKKKKNSLNPKFFFIN